MLKLQYLTVPSPLDPFCPSSSSSSSRKFRGTTQDILKQEKMDIFFNFLDFDIKMIGFY
jgi:hypothetical protein